MAQDAFGYVRGFTARQSLFHSFPLFSTLFWPPTPISLMHKGRDAKVHQSTLGSKSMLWTNQKEPGSSAGVAPVSDSVERHRDSLDFPLVDLAAYQSLPILIIVIHRRAIGGEASARSGEEGLTATNPT